MIPPKWYGFTNRKDLLKFANSIATIYTKAASDAFN